MEKIVFFIIFLQCLEGTCFIANTFFLFNTVNIVLSQVPQYFSSLFHCFSALLCRQFYSRIGENVICNSSYTIGKSSLVDLTVATSLPLLRVFQHSGISWHLTRWQKQHQCTTHGLVFAKFHQGKLHISLCHFYKPL